MKVFKDGNAYCITKDNFVNLQESPSIWFDEDSEIGQIFKTQGMSVLNLPVGNLLNIKNKLNNS